MTDIGRVADRRLRGREPPVHFGTKVPTSSYFGDDPPDSVDNVISSAEVVRPIFPECSTTTNNTFVWDEYRELMRQLELTIPAQQSKLSLPMADDVKISDTGPVMRSTGDMIELVSMRFGFPPANPKSGPIFNFRSEGRRFRESKRCLVPASAFFEFTGK